jgi:PKD repeat protein
MPFVADFDHDATVPLGDIEYYWDFGDPTSGLYNTSTDSIPYHQYMYPGEYDITLTMISDYGCETTVIFNDLVNVHPVPNAEFYANPVAVSLFNAEVSFFDESDLANQWIWNFGDGSIGTLQNPSHIYTVAGEYNVMLLVRSDDGCTDTVWHMISVKEEHTFWAPDAFSPGDGLTNNFFYPKGVGIEETDYQLFIYDRWGQIIFESEIYPEGTSQIFEQAGGWNGRYDGSGAFVPVGTYTWRVRLVDVNGVKHEYTGAVTVVR